MAIRKIIIAYFIKKCIGHKTSLRGGEIISIHQDFILQKQQNSKAFINIRKSYEINGLKELASILLSKKMLSLRIIDNSGAILWQNKSNPETEIAKIINK